MDDESLEKDFILLAKLLEGMDLDDLSTLELQVYEILKKKELVYLKDWTIWCREVKP